MVHIKIKEDASVVLSVNATIHRWILRVELAPILALLMLILLAKTGLRLWNAFPRQAKRLLTAIGLSCAMADDQVKDLTNDVKTVTMDPVAQGGFSDVYRGEWEVEVTDKTGMKCQVKRLIAIKLIRCFSARGFDFNGARERLDREVNFMCRARHPNVMKAYGISFHMSGRPTIVMPWYGNGTAREYLQTNPGADRLHLIRDISQGLRHLHTLKTPIIHGDLKASNILITDDGRAVISDFGSSHLLEKGRSIKMTTIEASDRYCPPELLLLKGDRYMLASDIWSVACTACEILVGVPPYSNRTRSAVIRLDIMKGIKPFKEPIGPPGDRYIWQLFNRCWAPPPLARPSASEFQEAIELVWNSAGTQKKEKLLTV